MVAIGTDWTQVDYWQSQQYDTYFQEYYYCQVRLVAKVTQSVANNSSRVDFKWQKRLSAWKTGRSAYNNYTYSWSITTSGHSATMSFALGTVNSTTWTDVGSSDYWSNVGHNADGSLSVSATAKGYRFDGTSFSTAETLTLPTIPRASKATVNPDPLTLSAASNTLTVTTNRASSSFTHTVKVTCGTWSDTQTGVGASTTFSVPQTVVSTMTGLTMDCYVETTTYSGSTQIGSTTTSYFKVQVDTSQEHAVIGTVTLSDTNADTSAVESAGSFIKGASNLQAVIAFSVAGSYTELASAEVSIDDVTETFPLSGTSGSVTFNKNKVVGNTLSIKVTDSRGYTVTKAEPLTIIPYESVWINTVQIFRCNSSGAASETGTYIHYEIEVRCFEGTFGNTNNEINLYESDKLSTASNYGAETLIDTHTVGGTGSVITYTFSGVCGGSFNASNQYDIKFTVRDLFSANSGIAVLMRGVPVISWSGERFCVYGELDIHDRDDVTKFTTIYPDGYRWNFLGTATASTAIPLDLTNYSEVMLVLRYEENATYTWASSTVIPVAEIGSTYIYCMMPARIAPTSSTDFGGVVRIKEDSANTFEFVANRASQSPTLNVYAR